VRPLIWYPIWTRGSEARDAAELGMGMLAANAAIKILVFTLFAEMMHRIAEAARFRHQVVSTLPVGFWVADRNGFIIEASPMGARIWGAEALGSEIRASGISSREEGSHEPAKPGIPALDRALGEGRTATDQHLRIMRPDGTERAVLSSAAPIRNPSGGIIGALLVQMDITESKRLEEERESLIQSLQAAQKEVKILKGMLPICSGCKRIRDERKSWVPLESYISSHSEADFTHGICPECMKEMYPWFTP